MCNGSNSTPDLRDKFVVGAGSTYAVGATGGSANAIVVSHTHSISDSGHNHDIVTRNGGSGTRYIDYNTTTPGSTLVNVAETTTETTGITVDSFGSSGTNANLPPYYALCYIMKT